MLASELLQNIVDVPSNLDQEITGLALDSRQVIQGSMFFAFPGTQADGRNYIEQAIASGANVIIAEEHGAALLQLSAAKQNVPIFLLPNLQSQLGVIAARFYNHPSHKLNMIGVTGTNGKTSCCVLLAQAFARLGIKCGIVGTLGIGFIENLEASPTTTPDTITLQSKLADFCAGQAQVVAMEVSSHGLAQHRVNAINFNIGVFTNLTRDHLDYHQNMEDYYLAKRKLFIGQDLTYALINADDEFGLQLINELAGKLTVIGYSIRGVKLKVPMIQLNNMQITKVGYRGDLSTPWGDGVLTTKLLGQFNLSNLLVVVGVLGINNIPLVDALTAIKQLNSVVGRMQVIAKPNAPKVIVDFAHTPDALQQALQTLREHCHGKLWCVFGCGGDRDRGKRALMGQVAEQYSDYVVLTNDNPRTEDPQQIINDIKAGIAGKASIEYDRKKAISETIVTAKQDDVILIAGKGAENYQIIGQQKLDFSDIECVKNEFNKF